MLVPISGTKTSFFLEKNDIFIFFWSTGQTGQTGLYGTVRKSSGRDKRDSGRLKNFRDGTNGIRDNWRIFGTGQTGFGTDESLSRRSLIKTLSQLSEILKRFAIFLSIMTSMHPPTAAVSKIVAPRRRRNSSESRWSLGRSFAPASRFISAVFLLSIHFSKE